MTLGLSAEAVTDELLDEAEVQKAALDATPRWRVFRRWRRDRAWMSTLRRIQANEQERVCGPAWRPPHLTSTECIVGRCRLENPEPDVHLHGVGLAGSWYECGHCGATW